MRKINSLSDLLMEELADLLNAEKLMIDVLLKMAEASQFSVLKILLNELAQYMINVRAIDLQRFSQQTNQLKDLPPKPESGGFYIPEGRFRRVSLKEKSRNTDVSRFISEGNPNIQEPPVNGE